jgi:ribose-phosphate pyrophosphokinase
VKTIVFGMPGNERLADALAKSVGMDRGIIHVDRFPDGESHIRLATDVSGRNAIIVCGLDHPDGKMLPLIFAASAARDFGARRIGIVAPYFAYLRQDARFQSGDALSSVHFAKLVSRYFDWIACMDPHLHRFKSMEALCSIPVVAIHAAPAIGEWIRANVVSPVIVGPDDESRQWASDVAERAGAPYEILRKERKGDRDVNIVLPSGGPDWSGLTPVLLDDIISTGGTMMTAVARLLESGSRPPVCVGVHAIFADDSYEKLRKSGAARVVTCNTIAHESNAIDVDPAIVNGVLGLLGRR